MGKQTHLYERHVAAGAKIVDFGGWDMPLHYGSQLDEHHAVRSGAGIFDVSHMTVVDIDGADSRNWLRRLLANDVERLTAPGKGLYSCMLNPAGGVIDDLIVYRQQGPGYRVIINAATHDADLNWMHKTAADFDVSIGERTDLAMLAVQGPEARATTAPLLPEGLGEQALGLESFESLDAANIFMARTGYTGEDGWEILLKPAAAGKLWDELITAGVQPCGLGARDTLRLEAGLNLYGQDMDMQASPLVSNLGWTVCWEPGDRDFIGRPVLEEEKRSKGSHRLVGLVLEDRGVIRAGQRVVTDAGDGRVTSGGFSPTLECSIALARVPSAAGEHCEVEIRSNFKPARIVRPPFVKQGQILV